MFQDKVVVVTGGAAGIGKCIAEDFRKAGAQVSVIDKAPGNHYVGDIGDKSVLEAYAEAVIARFGHVDILVNNALPIMRGIEECTYEEFQYALAVGVTAPFYLSKLLAPHMPRGGSIINISSSRDRMSQPQTESYTAAKGGIAALTHAMAVSFGGTLRVTSISLAGLTPSTGSMKGRMPISSLPVAWEIPWILPTWCCSLRPTRQALSPARISALTVVRQSS